VVAAVLIEFGSATGSIGLVSNITSTLALVRLSE